MPALNRSQRALARRLYGPLAIPFVAMLVLVSLWAAEELATQRAAAPLHALAELATPVGALVHQIQLERGLTEVRWSSQRSSDRPSSALEAQWEATDAAARELEGSLAALPPEVRPPASLVSRVHQLVVGLPELRERAARAELSTSAARIAAYSEINAALLGLLEAPSTREAALDSFLRSYRDLVELKEQTGIERAAGAAQLREGPREGVWILAGAQARADATEVRLRTSHRPELLAPLGPWLHSPHRGEVDALRRALRSGELGPNDLDRWFGTMTRYIDDLHRAEESLLDVVGSAALDAQAEARATLWMLGLGFLGLLAATLGLAAAAVRPLLGFAATMGRIADETALGRSGPVGPPTPRSTDPLVTLERTTVEVLALAERFGLACDSAGLGIWEWQIPTNTLVWDERMFGLYGVTPEEFGGAYEAWRAGLHPDDAERGDQEVQAALAGAPFSTRFRVVWPTGEVRWLAAEALVIRDERGEPLRMVGINRDITREVEAREQLQALNQDLDRRIAERTSALRAREAELAAILDHTRDAIITFDGSETIVRANAMAEASFGYAQEALVGAPFSMLLDPPLELGAAPLDRDEAPVIARRRDGHRFPAELDLDGFAVEDGHRYVATIRDITRRKELDDALIEAKERAEEASRTKSRFVANMSHEIRTPMSAILGMAQLALQTDLDERQRRYVTAVHASAQALLSLLNDILDISKMEAGALELESVPFSLERDVFEPLGRVLGFSAHEKDIELVYDFGPEVPDRLLGDPLRLTQILTNLASNALKFSEAGSEILIRVRAERITPEEVELGFVVRDRGIGMSPEQLDKALEAFGQADTSTTREYGGTGLGLAISHHLVERQGGTLTLESVLGYGTTAEVRLTFPIEGSRTLLEAREARVEAQDLPVAASFLQPLSPSDLHDTAHDTVGEGSGEASRTRTLLQLEGRRVLLAEDNKLNQEVIRGLLAAVGVAIDVASNGREAVRLATTRAYDAVLMDCQMPVLDGYEATRLLRAEGLTDLPIIALTANAMAEDRARALEAGMDEHLAKPIDVHLLYEVLGKQIAGRPEGPSRPSRRAPTTESSPREAPEALPALPGLDVAAAVERLAGNPDTYRRLLGIFLSGHADDGARLEQAESPADVASVAHRLAGVAGNLGGATLHRACKELEARARQAETRAELDDGVAAVAHALDEIVEGIERLLPHEPRTPVPSSLDADAASALCDRLAALIEEADMEAHELVPRLAGTLPVEAAEVVASLQAALDAFDHEGARHLVAEVRERYLG